MKLIFCNQFLQVAITIIMHFYASDISYEKFKSLSEFRGYSSQSQISISYVVDSVWLLYF